MWYYLLIFFSYLSVGVRWEMLHIKDPEVSQMDYTKVGLDPATAESAAWQ